MGIISLVVSICAVLLHIMWITQRYRIISVLKSNMETIKVNILTNIRVSNIFIKLCRLYTTNK